MTSLRTRTLLTILVPIVVFLLVLNRVLWFIADVFASIANIVGILGRKMGDIPVAQDSELSVMNGLPFLENDTNLDQTLTMQQELEIVSEMNGLIDELRNVPKDGDEMVLSILNSVMLLGQILMNHDKASFETIKESIEEKVRKVYEDTKLPQIENFKLIVYTSRSAD